MSTILKWNFYEVEMFLFTRHMQEFNLFVLMYADVIVIFSESMHELQEMLKTVVCLNTSTCDLASNVTKTKIVFFRNEGNNRNDI